MIWSLSCYFSKNQFLLTLWEDFGEIEGNEIEAKMEKEMDLIVILGRNIGISTFQGTCIELFTNKIYIITKRYASFLSYRVVTAE